MNVYVCMKWVLKTVWPFKKSPPISSSPFHHEMELLHSCFPLEWIALTYINRRLYKKINVVFTQSNWQCKGMHLLNGNKSILKGKKAFWGYLLLYILDVISLCPWGAIHGDKMKRDGAFLILSTSSELKPPNFFRHMRSHHRSFHFPFPLPPQVLIPTSLP